jgi:hypothetical protein
MKVSRNQQNIPVSKSSNRESQINGLWKEYTNVQKNKQLMSLFERTSSSGLTKEAVDSLLKQNRYPQRSKIQSLNFGNWKKPLDQKFIKDGYIYLMRGDHKDLENDGFYSRPYGYGKLTTEELSKQLKSPNEVGFFLYNDKNYLKAKPESKTVAEQLAYMQSSIGGSSFVSATTNLACAQAGTGNQPSAKEKENTEIYILKIPVEDAIASDTGNHFGLEENEILIPDFVSPLEIIAKFDRNDTQGVYGFFEKELGLT